MKSRTKSMHIRRHSLHQKGSLIVEAMVAISILSIFIVSALTLSWSARALRPVLENKSKEILAIKDTIETWAALPQIFTKWFDDSSLKIFPLGATSSISTLVHDEKLSFGSSTCVPTSEGINFGSFQPRIDSSGLSIGTDVFATDIIARNGFVYLAADSAVSSRSDLFIFDMKTSGSPTLVSAIQVGPGLNGLVLAGHYLYVANTSTGNQLVVIDISNRSSPSIVTRFRLPLPTSTTTPTVATSIAYFDKKIYLGTEKWGGPEFEIIDVSNPLSPVYLGGLEVGSIVKNILVRGERAYIANAGTNELMLVDVHDPTSPNTLSTISPIGWQIEEGNRLVFHHDKLWYGRAGGGFGNSSYQELITFPAGSSFVDSLVASSSIHVSGGVYGIAIIDPYVFVLTGDQGGTIDIWDDSLEGRIASVGIGGMPVALSCDGSDFYVATSDSRGFIRIRF